MAEVSYGSLPFAEQIAFFRRKLGNQLLTQAWTDVQLQEHDHAFMVAGANRADLLEDFATAVDRAIAEGRTLEEFRKDFDSIVAKHGWSYKGGRNWRSRVIYETNLRTSYAAGRWEQLQAVKQARPYWQYEHSDAVMHPRPLHKAWGDAKLVLSADDPWWHTHFPPNGWGCQCTVKSLAERDLRKLGKTGPDQAPEIRMETKLIGQRSPGGPREVETPEGIDPGFGYAPGRDAWQKALESVAAQQRGDAETWESIIARGAGDYGRPVDIPLLPAPAAHLAPRPTTEQGLLELVRDVLGADHKTFDVKGLPIDVDARFLTDHIKDDLARGVYLPWLEDTLDDPFEVWLQLERNRVTGQYRIRARIIKAYDLGNGRSILFVANQADGHLLGWTFIPPRGRNYLQNQRNGVLWYGMPQQ